MTLVTCGSFGVKCFSFVVCILITSGPWPLPLSPSALVSSCSRVRSFICRRSLREYLLQPDVTRFPSLRVSWLPRLSVAPGGPWQWAVSCALDQGTAPRKNVAWCAVGMVVNMVRILTRRQTSARSPVEWNSSSPESSFGESRMGATIFATRGNIMMSKWSRTSSPTGSPAVVRTRNSVGDLLPRIQKPH